MTVCRRPVASWKPQRVGKSGLDRVATRKPVSKSPLRHAATRVNALVIVLSGRRSGGPSGGSFVRDLSFHSAQRDAGPSGSSCEVAGGHRHQHGDDETEQQRDDAHAEYGDDDDERQDRTDEHHVDAPPMPAEHCERGDCGGDDEDQRNEPVQTRRRLADDGRDGGPSARLGGDLRASSTTLWTTDRVITIATMPPRPSHSAARQRLRATRTVATSSTVVTMTNTHTARLASATSCWALSREA